MIIREFHPILDVTVTNNLTRVKKTIKRFQSERFVFTVEVEAKRYKVFQIFFGKSDGSLYISFPYFDNSEGILGIGTLPSLQSTSQIDLRLGGKVTTNRVKYTHHPDGEVHFSQEGKITTSIRKKALPLENAEGHIFSLQFQGLSHYEIDPTPSDHEPTLKRTTLNFRFDANKPEAIKIVGRWYSAKNLIERSHGEDIGPHVIAQTSDGKIVSTILVGPMKGTRLENHVLMINCEEIPRLDKERDAVLSFVAGFDDPSQFLDPAKAAAFLCLLYPVSDYEKLADQIGTVDIQHVI